MEKEGKRGVVNGKQRLGRTDRIIRFASPSGQTFTFTSKVPITFSIPAHFLPPLFPLAFSSPNFAIRSPVSLPATFSNLARPNFLEILAFGFFEPGRRGIEQRWKILIIPPQACLPAQQGRCRWSGLAAVPDFTERSITIGDPSLWNEKPCRNATRGTKFSLQTYFLPSSSSFEAPR